MKERSKGTIFAASQALIWSLFPVLAVYGYQSVDTRFTLAVVTTLAAGFFAITLTLKHSWHELLTTKAYPFILGNTFLNAFLFFGLVFWGTSMTSAGNAAIILRMENFFSIVLLGGIGFDKITKREVFGGILMISGAIIVLFPGQLELNKGDIVILIASIIPVLGNVCSKKARHYVSSSAIMFIRNILVAPFFWILVLWYGSLPTVSLSWQTMVVLFVNGFFVMGFSKLLWIEAIHRIPISTGNSISSVNPLFTLIAAYFILGEAPTIWQLSAIMPVILGLNLIVRNKKHVS